MRRLNRYALDYYLRGEAGVGMQQAAQAELFRRGRDSATMTVEQMCDHLESLGYGIITPDDREIEEKFGTCPWCGHTENGGGMNRKEKRDA